MPFVLPIDSILPSLQQRLHSHHTLVVQAPPGAGKTTGIPLALLQQPWLTGKILLIQPRRLAVYGAARRMASILNEKPGDTVGYRTRYDQKTSARTRIDVITEGIFLRQIQSDPELNGIDVVIFDEFHERAVTIDLGLAFALESQAALRDDLRIIVMSATLDGERLSDWLHAPFVQSDGRLFPVETHYTPLPINTYLEQHTAHVVLKSLQQDEGNILVFLPGLRELQRVKQRLEDAGLPEQISVHLLHASLPQDVQERAIASTTGNQRKVVLSTNVAETSVTIEGIRVVIDSGLVRVARYDERSGMERLHTETISAASAEQRRGRAGRTQAGTCYRLWSETAHHQLQRFTEAEILHADLAPVALEICQWGAPDSSQLKLLNHPPAERYARALQLLAELDALDHEHRITPQGRQLTSLGMHPRLAKLVWSQRNSPCASAALASAAIIAEGDPLRFDGDSHQADLHLRLALWQSMQGAGDVQRGTWQRVQNFMQQLSRRINVKWEKHHCDTPDIGIALAQAFPDRVGQRRADHKQRFLLANGKGMQLAPRDSLSGHDYIVVLDTDGAGTEPRIRLACALTLTQLQTALGGHIQKNTVMEWNATRGAVDAETRLQLGALILQRQRLPAPWPDTAQHCLLQALQHNELRDLPWNDTTSQLIARLQWLHQQHPESWPDVSRPALIASADTWLLPYLTGMTSLNDVRNLDLHSALKNTLEWSRWSELDKLAPADWPLPTGSLRTLEYSTENGPVLRARLQEFYGLQQHPVLPGGQRLLLELLSPAQRPLQLTRDLPGFWQGSYKDVAKEMRGRYPKHFWPDNPHEATATTRTKRNMEQP